MTRFKRVLLGLSALSLGLSAPITFSRVGVTSNDACAQTGTCCGTKHTCVVNGQPIAIGYWQAGSGECGPAET